MKVTSALQLAGQGFRVFPLLPNGKKPAIDEWPSKATTDRKTIVDWWKTDKNRNIGIATGGGFFVVDVDTKKGRDGLASLDSLETFYDLPASYRVTTPSGGLHVYLRKPESTILASNSDKVLDHPGLDIRAEGGFVVGPGSTIDDAPYVATDSPIDDAPTCIFPLLKKPVNTRDDTSSSVELDLPANIERTIDYLVNRAEAAVEGAGGDETTFSVAAECRALGVSEHTALELMLEHWNEQKANPQWQPEDLAKKVENAFQYGQGAPGGKTAAGEFGALDIEIGEAPARSESLEPEKKEAQRQGPIVARPYTWADPAVIPPRQWVFGRHLIRKFVSVTVAPGNIGKSSLTITEAISMVSGRNIIGQAVGEPLRVWYWNLEDPYDELQRRVQAACQHFEITPKDLEGRLFVDSGRDQALRLAVADKNGARIVRPVVDGLIGEMKRLAIDVLIVDPFISSHAVPENDNPAIDMVAKEWGRVAEAGNAAIELVHHTRKQGGDEITTESSRGGKALTDAARDVRVLNRMSKEEAAKAGIENHRLYFRTYSDKANMSPPADSSDWFKLESVSLANGDEVGVVTKWEWPDPFAEITRDDIRKVQALIAGKEFRESVLAKDWIGIAVGEVVGLDPSNTSEKEKIKAMVRAWIDEGWLKVRKIRDEKGKDRPVVEVGKLMQENEFEAPE